MKNSLPPALRKTTEIVLFVCLLLFLPLLFPENAQGEIFRVKPGGTGSGVDWDNALGEAEFIAKLKDLTVVSADEFWVAEGSYCPTTSADVEDSFVMKPGVSLYGGFAGGETERNERDPRVNVTILTGDIGGGKRSEHVVKAGDEVDATAVLDGITITAGNAVSGSSIGGGGMRIDGGSPTVRNCIFSNNSSSGSGGGMRVAGGGMPQVTDCIFSGNSAHHGGGMRLDGNAAVRNCIFSNNSSSGTSGFGGNGGAISVSGGGSATVEDCTFSGNTAYDGGGMYLAFVASLTVRNCIFSENSSTRGGGMYSQQIMAASMTNCTFSGNNSTRGGGMYLDSTSRVAVMNCTFSKNHALYGGGIYSGSESTETVINCILWGDSEDEISYYNKAPAVRYSVVQGGFAGGTDIITEDPLLGPLADNGGLTKTFALRKGSSAIDKGTGTGAPSTDQRGVTRPRGSGVDMGAYEFGGPDAPIPSLPLEGVINVTLTPTLATGSFHSPDPCIHTATEWQVDDDSTFSIPMAADDITGPLTERTLPGNVLDYGTAYFWRVRFQDDLETWSPWSEVRTFSTMNDPTPPAPGDLTPIPVSPADGAIGLPVTPTLEVSFPPSAAIPAGSQWQVSKDSAFGSLAAETELQGETADWTISDGKLTFFTRYYWRVRARDGRGTWSKWSAVRNFTTERTSGSGCSAGGSGTALLLLPLALLVFRKKR